MNTIRLFCLMIFLFWGTMVQAKTATALYPFEDDKKAAQFQHLLSDLRCLVCQNQDLVDSNAEFAKDLRREIYQKVQEGESDQAIIEYLTARFGEYILFKPPVESLTWILWGAPLCFILIGLGLYWKMIRHAK